MKLRQYKVHKTRVVMNIKRFFRRYLLVGLGSVGLLMLISSACKKTQPVRDLSVNVSQQAEGHADWTLLLEKYVSTAGAVNYARWQKDGTQKLQEYLAWLADNEPPRTASQDEKLSYWINVYNAFTIHLVLGYYPVNSIKNILPGGVKTPWKHQFIRLKRWNGLLSLDQIENEIIRARFNEPRIHFALVCAATSCPILTREAYVTDSLEKQLTNQARVFLNDRQKNQVPQGRLSSIFNWFQGDFTKSSGTLRAYVNQYADNQMPAGTRITFLTYDWSLNQ